MIAFLLLLLYYALGQFYNSSRFKDLVSRYIIVANDCLQGNIDSTLELLRQTIMEQIQDDLVFIAATYDYSKLLMKLGRNVEVVVAIDKLMYPSESLSKVDIARKYKDLYV